MRARRESRRLLHSYLICTYHLASRRAQTGKHTFRMKALFILAGMCVTNKSGKLETNMHRAHSLTPIGGLALSQEKEHKGNPLFRLLILPQLPSLSSEACTIRAEE